MIFWQIARMGQRARPGQRLPTRRAAELEQLTVDIETREGYAYEFAGRAVGRRRSTLAVGDDAVPQAAGWSRASSGKTLEDSTRSLAAGARY